MTEEGPVEQDQPIGQRTLAAIMFTDVAEFSRLMGENEERTMVAVKRDLRLIANLCTEAKGRVLKYMGDGVLAIFTSGVQAVECAQEIQRQLSEQARGLPQNEVLHHRIGMHLGDVFIHEDEVMGDGVNIAARLQTEAPPGGICISQALYGVVKRRMALRTVHQGAKQLKNIREEVHIYQIIVDDGLGSVAKRSAAQGILSKRKSVLWLVAITIILAGSAALYMAGRDSRLSTASEITVDSLAVDPSDDGAMDSPAAITPPSDQSIPANQSSEDDEDNAILESSDKDAIKQPHAIPSEESDRIPEEAVPKEPEPGDPLIQEATAAFRQLDKDDNRRITPNELPLRGRREFLRADKNNDGALEWDEFLAAFRFIRDVRQRIRPSPPRGG